MFDYLLNLIKLKWLFGHNHDTDYELSPIMTRQELIKYIRKSKNIKLDVNDDFTKISEDISITSDNLIGINLELYEALKKILPKYESKKNKFYKKFGPSPKFTFEDYINSKIPKPLQDVKMISHNFQISKPISEFNKNNVTLMEFNQNFKQGKNSMDMCGISKKMLFLLSPKHKQKLIDKFNLIYNNYDTNFKHSIGSITFIHKNGNADQVSSFRPIVSISNCLNHFHRILSSRITNYLISNDYFDKETQKGGISCSLYPVFEQIYKVKSCINSAYKKNKTATVIFLDISDAFGSLELSKLKKVMEEYYFPNEIIDYVMNFYNNLELYSKNTDSEKTIEWCKFNGNRGLIQGCSMSPILFSMIISHILSILNKKYKNTHGYEYVNNMRILFTAFVDDICLIANNNEDAKQVYDDLKQILLFFGLELNIKKSAVMIINQTNTNIDNIPVVKSYKYLGTIINDDGNNTSSYNKLVNNILRFLIRIDNKKISNDEKIDMFNKIMLPIIQKSLLTLYDLDVKDKVRIASIVKQFLTKWNYQGDLQLFTNFNQVLNDSKDSIIINLAKEEKNNVFIDENLNNFMVSTNIKFSYDDIQDINFNQIKI